MGRIRYSTVAHRNLHEAADFYTREASASVASSFYDDVRVSAGLAFEHPEIGETHSADIRKIRCHTFPYYIYYRRTAGGLDVLAVRHQKRRPGRRLERLR